MAKKTTIIVEGTDIRLLTDNQNDFISLTDLTQNFEGGAGLVEKWFRNRNTVEFLGMWEKIYNPQFNEAAFKEIANQAGLNTFMLSAKKALVSPPKPDVVVVLMPTKILPWSFAPG
nr:KilA-N domain-containing protein [Haliscomenobacter sp.]